MKKDYKTVFLKKSRLIKRDVLRKITLPYANLAFWATAEKPDFLGIGAPRSASTWLYKRLSLHPKVFMPKIKEIHFFDENRYSTYLDESNIRWYRTFYFNLDKQSHWRWYNMQFRQGSGLVKGEITPDYSALSPNRVKLIAEKYPDLKIIYTIRNPIDRAWSNIGRIFWHQLGIRPLDYMSESALLKSVLHPEVLIGGDYKNTIETWEKYFNQEKILYLFYDDITQEPRRELEKVCSFLNIDPHLLPDCEGDRKRVNKSPESEMPTLIRDKLESYYLHNIQYLQEKFARDFRYWLNSDLKSRL